MSHAAKNPESPTAVPAAARLSHDAFDRMVRALSSEFRVLAPRRFRGRGRFSDTDVIRYGEVASADEIVFDVKSDFSPKEILFPVVETLLLIDGAGVREPEEDVRPIVVFLRACDINGIDRLDGIFLRNGPADPCYGRRRTRLKFVLMECAASYSNCFCVAMGANRTDDFAVAVRRDDDEVRVLVRDQALAKHLPEGARDSDYTPRFVTVDDAPVRLPDPAALTAAVRDRNFFEHKMWKEYAKRCIACGRCNTHCVTCSCFTSFDASAEENPGTVERRRAWASCHVDRFTDLAGGHRFREDYGSRMRFKTMHKIYDYYLRFGRHMCVGCGRCDNQCPEYISFSTCINRVAEAVETNE